MTHAFNLRAEDTSAQPVRDLWREAGRLEDEPSMLLHGYPPHITLAIYEDVREAEMLAALDNAVADQALVTLTFVRIRCFAGIPLVLWLEPEPCPALARMHAAIHGAIDPARSHARYRPDRWAPHCTLALHIREPGLTGARAMAARPLAPFAVTFDRLEWVRFPPVAVLASRPLADRNAQARSVAPD